MMGWLVQCFYAYRIYILSKRRILIPAIVFVLASVSLGFAIGSTYHAFTQRYFASFDQWAWGVYVWLGTAVGADLVLTGALVYYLRQNKSGTDESDENHNGLIETIVRVTIENNLATGVTSIIHAGLFASMESNYHVIFNCESSSPSVTRSPTDRLQISSSSSTSRRFWCRSIRALPSARSSTTVSRSPHPPTRSAQGCTRRSVPRTPT